MTHPSGCKVQVASTSRHCDGAWLKVCAGGGIELTNARETVQINSFINQWPKSVIQADVGAIPPAGEVVVVPEDANWS